jgi:hypothetical protein
VGVSRRGGFFCQMDWLRDDDRRAQEVEAAAGGGVLSSGGRRMGKTGFIIFLKNVLMKTAAYEPH